MSQCTKSYKTNLRNCWKEETEKEMDSIKNIFVVMSDMVIDAYLAKKSNNKPLNERLKNNTFSL